MNLNFFRSRSLNSLAPFAGLLFLGLFVAFTEYSGWKDLQKRREVRINPEKERLDDTSGFLAKRLAFHDFEAGNTADTSTHVVAPGYNSGKSLRMNSFVNFSPGLWIRFSDFKPPAGSWLRARARVWYSGKSRALNCNLVATCNHNGVNYKYMSIPLEGELLVPGKWNEVMIDYRIPDPPDQQDVIQIYFWYRGDGWMLADDIAVTLYEKRED